MKTGMAKGSMWAAVIVGAVAAAAIAGVVMSMYAPSGSNDLFPSTSSASKDGTGSGDSAATGKSYTIDLNESLKLKERS